VLGVGGAVSGSLLAALPALLVLARAGLDLPGPTILSFRHAWDVPYGAFHLEIDPLSAVFLLVVLGVSGAAAVYGGEYLAHGAEARGPRRTASAWFFFNLLVAAMALVVVARNGILFLIAWEVMALASFFLVTLEDDEEDVQQAGRTYLIATHLAAAFLLALFAILGRQAGSLDFDQFLAMGPLAPSLGGALLILGLVGFGSKAGLVPVHVWLPEAHPAAPSHVSAVMSGAMITMGVYGLLRTLTFLGPPALWWGGLLVGVGLVSAFLGALLALAQHDLKRLLAYSTVENAGIITVGIGLGVLGVAAGSPPVAVLGFAGALFAVVNHALFKSLLFLGAGSVAVQTGTRRIDRLGGLFKRMPWTGTACLVGAAAASAVPPLNGFVGEFLVYLGALRGGATFGVAASLPALFAVGGLALVGGLAAAAMAKAFGIAFLGNARTEDAAKAREAGRAMRLTPGMLALACAVLGLGAPWIAVLFRSPLKTVTGLSEPELSDGLSGVTHPLYFVTKLALVLIALVALLAIFRRMLLSQRTVKTSVTWDCGYALPAPRMQYTGSSFVQPLTSLFKGALGTRRTGAPLEGIFPKQASLATHAPDVFADRLIGPAFKGTARALAKLRWVQHGRLNLYLLYVALTLLVLLIWKLG
jgi:hydrogenase-4 component B